MSRGQLFEEIGKWLDDHWRPVIPAFGAAVMGLSGVLLSRADWYWPGWWVGFFCGVVIAIWGTVANVKEATRVTALRRDIARLTEDLQNARDPRRVFVAVSALTEYYLVPLLRELLVQLGARGFRPTVFAPLANYSVREQEGHFREILNRRDDYVGGIVIPIEPERRRKELLEFVRLLKKPLVFVDNAPFETAADYPEGVVFIGVSSASGGELAARAVQAELGPKVRRILVVASRSQVARQSAFKKQCGLMFEQCEVVVDEGGRFSRAKAYKVVARHLRRSIQSRKPFDAVFCTADSMTLGCLDAMSAITEWAGTSVPVVFGYDAITETKRLAEIEESPLARVVVQDAHDIAVATSESLVRLVSGEVLRGPRLVEPDLYPTLQK